jgi:crossover junction endodeoxyribonuclease RuvC
MKILGIDPGLGIVGFGMVEISPSGEFENPQWGTICTSKDKPDSARLQEIYTDLTGLLQQVKPDVVSIERLFFFKNAKTMVPVSQARGVILLALESLKIPFFEYTPLEVKQAMTGYGKAEKHEIQEMVTRLLNLHKKPTPDDAADALAMAICHYNHTGRLHSHLKITSP